MGKKTNIRIIGEVLTFVSNILITLSIVGLMVYMYLLKPIFNVAISSVDYYDTGLSIINDFLNILNDNMILILSVGVTIIALIWVLRGIVIRSTGKVLSIIAIIFNIPNLIGLIGYAFILYDNLQPKSNGIQNESNDDYEYSNKLKYSLIGILLVILVPGMFIFLKNNISNSKEVVDINKPESIQSSNLKDIRADYQNKMIEAREVVTKENGINRYYSILINYLNECNIKNIEDANVIYELSDELLNNMYQECKAYMTEDSFSRLRDEQRKWVENKMIIEDDLKDNELKKYKTLIDITLDRCNELNNIN
ncbi:hypothetical protein EAI30_16330 [Romboutsia ilealis]|uniref:Lysozyme inhibitor LprI N-terminal domain-containing protein n=1 Tax=Romboutsia faecis TaxID=2764597 RepID=A0ABR7JKK2_9FIRM|nr:hypothetical protein [Romboutsia faecis]MBC5995457.1 hypothetical protein [Romboutsia faecis]MRN26181.1 hypothetical protein [Romboutsia ilealis]